MAEPRATEVLAAAMRAVELAAQALASHDPERAAQAIETAAELRRHYDQRFADNAKLYDERNDALTRRLQRQDDETDRRFDDLRRTVETLSTGKADGAAVADLGRQVAELREGKAGNDTVQSYKRWQIGLVVTVALTFIGFAITLGLTLLDYFTHGQTP